MELSVDSRQFVASVGVAAIGLLTSAFSYAFTRAAPDMPESARQRLRGYAVFTLCAGLYGASDIALVFLPGEASVVWLARAEVFLGTLCVASWFAQFKGAAPSSAAALVTRLIRFTWIISPLALLPNVVIADAPTQRLHFAGAPDTACGILTISGNFYYACLLATFSGGLARDFRRVRQQAAGARLEFAAGVVLLLAATNEWAVLVGLYRFYFLVPNGLGIAIVATAMAIVQHFVADTRRVDTLRALLEQRVADRTTELQSAELAIQRSERLGAVGALAAGVAHEVNNPLAAISGNVGYLLEKTEETQKIPTEFEPLLRDSLELTGRIERVVRQLLTAGRAAGGATSTTSVSLPSVLDTVLSSIPEPLRLSATVDMDIPADFWVRGDEAHIVQVFSNVISNALHAIEECEIKKISLTATRDGETITVTIVDSGLGMSTEIAARLFEPFFTTKPRDKGTGLGLAITRELVAALGGTLDLHTTQGVGTTCKISLQASEPAPDDGHQDSDVSPRTSPPPLTAGVRPDAHATTAASVERDVRVASGRPADAPSPANLLPRPSTTKPRVMIIDDERALAGSIARMLGGSFGVEIEVDSKTALDRLLADPASVDLILCDYSMPELGGKELFEALRAKQPNLASRFAFMTGGATDEEAMLFLRGQLQPVIEKPFQKASIVAMLSDLHAATTKDSAR